MSKVTPAKWKLLGCKERTSGVYRHWIAKHCLVNNSTNAVSSPKVHREIQKLPITGHVWILELRGVLLSVRILNFWPCIRSIMEAFHWKVYQNEMFTKMESLPKCISRPTARSSLSTDHSRPNFYRCLKELEIGFKVRGIT